MRYTNKYNRMDAIQIYSWDDDWTIDRNGNLIPKESVQYQKEIPTTTINPDYEMENSV